MSNAPNYEDASSDHLLLLMDEDYMDSTAVELFFTENLYVGPMLLLGIAPNQQQPQKRSTKNAAFDESLHKIMYVGKGVDLPN
jgi:hypothetical protein